MGGQDLEPDSAVAVPIADYVQKLTAGLMDAASVSELRRLFGLRETIGREAAFGLDGSRWLLLQPIRGLCNRLRALSSGILLSRLLRRVLLIQWVATKECCAGWEQLFDTHPEVRAPFASFASSVRPPHIDCSLR